ncbi:UDP-glucose/GDP-mannose dehydrogenase family protein [uncultured Porticoccus sp.]|uniref:UDP-glucose dehydrogenase family protein n=1 Tax=uncultured Porticoccus sp. TaxID=1256050 RepID=UPI00261DDFC6|nr:UDP-glucose/GDP-mannose dehydrogenase family protein [uncultured Porticoccus sp.]
MRVTVFGGGYVGLVTSVCLAHVGHQVSCIDQDALKIDALRRGIAPIFEPGLEDYLVEAQREGSLIFTTDAAEAVTHGEVIFIAVGTPCDEDGEADIRHVLSVADTIGEYLQDSAVIVNKSTVPVGTADEVRALVEKKLHHRALDIPFDVVSNPEFLKEGAAIGDFMKPDRIVLGTGSERATGIMRELYAPFNRNHEKLMVMDVRSAELTKYAANAMLATKISFINEIANLAEYLGADIEKVRLGIGADPRIGYHFIYPGCGYGGSCFPKDVRALQVTAEKVGYRTPLLSAVQQVNSEQKQRLFEKLYHYFNGDLKGKTIAVWGLAFKPRTDDMREAPSRVLLESLWQHGALVQAYDPRAMEECQRIYGDRDDLVLVGTKESAAKGADALVICTEWKHFWAPDFVALAEKMNRPMIVDGRNLFDPRRVAEAGFDYLAMGRTGVVKQRVNSDPAVIGARNTLAQAVT